MFQNKDYMCLKMYSTSIKTQDDLAYYQKNILDGHIVEFDFSGFES